MGYLNTSTVLLSKEFLLNVRGFKETDGIIKTASSYKKSVLDNIEYLLRKGLTYNYLYSVMKKTPNKDAYLPIEMFSSDNQEAIKRQDFKYPREKDELIVYGEFYYHANLQDIRQKTSYYYNEPTGEMNARAEEPFFLEMKDSFTIRDLVDYFLFKMNYKDTSIDTPSKRKALSSEYYKLKEIPLDKFLYLIDATSIVCTEEEKSFPKIFHGLLDYSDVSEKLYHNRKEILEEGGMTYVIPRSNTYY